MKMRKRRWARRKGTRLDELPGDGDESLGFGGDHSERSDRKIYESKNQRNDLNKADWTNRSSWR